MVSYSIHSWLLFDADWQVTDLQCLVQVCRGTAVMMVSPTQGTEEIPNPFAEADADA